MTLAEMMVALTIIAVLASVTLFAVNHHKSERDLDGARRQVLAMLDYARQTAITKGGVQVTFTNNAGFTCKVIETAATRSVLSTYTAPSTIKVTGTTSLVFTPNGSITGSGTTTLTFSSLNVNDTHTIVINLITGGAVLGP